MRKARETRAAARRTTWFLALALMCAGGAGALEAVVTRDGGAARQVKVCALLLQAAQWENASPLALPVLSGAASNAGMSVLRPSGWTLTNPLAPAQVSQELANLWNRAYNGPVAFDGLSASVRNDLSGTGNQGSNQTAWDDTAGAGANGYLAHCSPAVLASHGVGGSLPAVGGALTPAHPAYWEVPLTPRTVHALAGFDAVFIHTHRNLALTAQDQLLLRWLLDMGGTVYLENAHGLRLPTGANITNTTAAPYMDLTGVGLVDWFLKVQFVDGAPYAGGGPGRASDGLPLNSGGLGAVAPAWTAVNANHSLLSAVQVISAAEVAKLGSTQSAEAVMLEGSSARLLAERVLQVTFTNNWGNKTGTPEPALAVIPVGAGRLVLSAIDALTDVARCYGAGSVAADYVPDVKLILNLLGTPANSGGDARGGPTNAGVGAPKALDSLTPRAIWNAPSGGLVTPANIGNGSVDVLANPAVYTDAEMGLKEPLCAAKGIAYVQYKAAAGNYFVAAVDANPSADLDGDGSADDGPLRDVYTNGAPFDTLWTYDVGTQPVVGATVVGVRHLAKNVTYDVLITTQRSPNNPTYTLRLRALTATVDQATLNVAPAEVAGTEFYNWSPARGAANWAPATNGYVDVTIPGGANGTLVAAAAPAGYPQRAPVSQPVAHNGLIYFCAAYSPPGVGGTPAPPGGEWIQVNALRLVPDAAAGGAAGTLAWRYPDPATYPGESPAASGLTTTLDYWRLGALKAVDPVMQYVNGSTTLNYVNNTANPSHLALNVADPRRWVQLMPDATNLRPVVGLAKDNRCGLTVPTVFVNSLGGDVWAVSCDPGALGWRLNHGVDLSDPTGRPYTVTINTPTPVTVPPANAHWRLTTDENGNTVTDVTIDEGYYRASVYGATDYHRVTLNYYTQAGTPHSEPRTLYPRQRLLRADRASGYETAAGDTIDCLGWSTSAPLLWSGDTVVANSLPMHRGAGQPAGLGNIGTLYGSGLVTFFDSGYDAQRPTSNNPNDYGAVRWAFNPAIVTPRGLFNIVAGAQPPNLWQFPTAGAYGSPVRYGQSVVVAGEWFDFAGNTTGTPQSGFVMGVDPAPSFTSRLPAGALDRDTPTYLLTRAPTGTLLATAPTPDDINANRHWVVHPSQYALDYGNQTLSLRPETAHVTRPLHPAAGQLRVYPLPLYGRQLWLVKDANRNGLFDGADSTYTVYVPPPVRWVWLPDTLVIDSPEMVVAGSVSVRDALTGAAVPFSTPEAVRSHVLLITDPSYRGKKVLVGYTRLYSGAVTNEEYIVPSDVPGIFASPVVMGDRLYVGGTQYQCMDPVGSVVARAYPNSGLHAFWYGHDSKVIGHATLDPNRLPGWSNLPAATPAATFVRGAPVASGDSLFVSFGLRDAAGNYVAPLYTLGAAPLLVTESLRVAKVNTDGGVPWQLTGFRALNGADRPVLSGQFNPAGSSLLTFPLTRASRAHALSGGDLLVVDTGGNRVVQVDSQGVARWPLDARASGGALYYWGLRDLGLNRPTDAARFTVSAGPLAGYQCTAVADKGNRRVVLAASYDRWWNGGVQSYFFALAGQATDDAGGRGVELTAPQVYNAGSRSWVELPYAELQDWDPVPGEPAWTTEGVWVNSNIDRYLVARVDGSDQLFNVDLFPAHNGELDANGDGQADGIKRNLGLMVDRWSNGAVFRGLRAFRRFRLGARAFLAVVTQDDINNTGARVAIYELAPSVYAATALDGVPGTYLKYLVPPAGGLPGRPWTFTRNDYRDQVYTNGTNTAYYQRQGASATDIASWYGGGAKGWNPLAITKPAASNVLVIVNGAANSVNQTASNSEVLLVRFDPNDVTNKSVEQVLPDLTTTANYPASLTATRTRPTIGSYPVSSPVWAAQ